MPILYNYFQKYQIKVARISKILYNFNMNKREVFNKEDSGLGFLLGNVMPIILSIFFVCCLFMFGLNAEDVEGEMWYLILATLSSQIALLLSFFMTCGVRRVKFSAVQIKKKISPKTLFICLLISLVCFFGLYNFIGVVDFGLASLGYKAASTSLPLNTAGDLVLNLFLLALLPAIIEELLFRGVIFRGLQNSNGTAFAVWFSGLLFALVHGSLGQFVYPFLMGCVFALIVLRTGNFLCSMVVHFLNNTLVIVFSYITNTTGFSFDLGTDAIGILLSILIALVAGLVIFLIFKFLLKRSVDKEEKKSKGQSLYMWIGLTVSVIVFLIMTISSF